MISMFNPIVGNMIFSILGYLRGGILADGVQGSSGGEVDFEGGVGGRGLLLWLRE